MRAKLKDTYRWGSVTLDGSEYVKSEYRPITSELAKNHIAILEVQNDVEVEPAKKAVEKPAEKIELASDVAPVTESIEAEPSEEAPIEKPSFDNNKRSRKNSSDR